MKNGQNRSLQPVMGSKWLQTTWENVLRFLEAILEPFCSILSHIEPQVGPQLDPGHLRNVQRLLGENMKNGQNRSHQLVMGSK